MEREEALMSGAMVEGWGGFHETIDCSVSVAEVTLALLFFSVSVSLSLSVLSL